MKAIKAFIKPSEAPQRSLKVKISVNFPSSSGIGTGSVKKYPRGSVLLKKRVLKNFAKLTRKHLCPRLFLINLQPSGLNFIKKETPTQVFSNECCEIFKNTFFIQHLRWTASVIL